MGPGGTSQSNTMDIISNLVVIAMVLTNTNKCNTVSARTRQGHFLETIHEIEEDLDT